MSPIDKEELGKLPPIERAVRAKEFMDQARDDMAVLSEIRAEALGELYQTGTSVADIAKQLGVSRQQINRTLRAPPMLLDFVVPDSIDITEEPPEGEFFTGDNVLNATLEQLRAALLQGDHRWELQRVTSLRDRDARQHLVVWVRADPDDEVQVLIDVGRIVADVIPGARLETSRWSAFY